jgi:hypothetical protein
MSLATTAAIAADPKASQGLGPTSAETGLIGLANEGRVYNVAWFWHF